MYLSVYLSLYHAYTSFPIQATHVYFNVISRCAEIMQLIISFHLCSDSIIRGVPHLLPYFTFRRNYL